MVAVWYVAVAAASQLELLGFAASSHLLRTQDEANEPLDVNSNLNLMRHLHKDIFAFACM